MIMLRVLALLLLLAELGFAQPLVIESSSDFILITFDSAREGFNEGRFEAGGFTADPDSTQINSQSIEIRGFSSGDLDFGGTGTGGDFSRGLHPGGVGTGGIYAFNTGMDNVALGFQATGTDFTPGELTLRFRNSAMDTLSSIYLGFTIWELNDQNRSTRIVFSHGPHPDSLNSESEGFYETMEEKDTLGWSSVQFIWTPDSLRIPPSSVYYLSWDFDDLAGTGSRDEIAIDNILIDMDPDGDGLLNYEEVLLYRTNPLLADTDMDSIPDNDEIIIYGTSPLDPDSDGDGLTDFEELSMLSTDPLNPDSDGDGCGDLYESMTGKDPLVADSDEDGDGSLSCDGDCDDNDPEVFPGAPSLPDGKDNDCDGIVDRAGQIITFDIEGEFTFGDSPVELNATADSRLPVSFAIEAGNARLESNHLRIEGAGEVAISALQSGNEFYAPAEPVTRVIQVGKSEQVLRFEGINDFEDDSTSVDLIIEASSGLEPLLEFSENLTIDDYVITAAQAGPSRITAWQPGDENYQPSDTIVHQFCVLPVPIINVDHDRGPLATLRSNYSSGNLWLLEGDTLDATGDTLVLDQTGFYQLNVDVQGCGGLSEEVPVFFTSITQESSLMLKIFPNPVQNWLYIVSQPGDVKNIEVHGIHGESIQVSYHVGANGLRVNVSDLKTGLYVLSLYRHGQKITHRIVKH